MGSAIQGPCEGSFFSSVGVFLTTLARKKPSCPCSRGSGGTTEVAAESGARRSLSAQHPNLLQWVLMMHLLMLTCPRPHRPPMWSSSGTALRWDLLQTPSALRGLRPYIAFSLHLGRLRVPSARRVGGDTMRSVQGTLRSHGARGLYKCKTLLFSRG